jgi:D-amino-acid oxidase
MGTAQHIFESCAQLAPSLKDSNETKILRHQVGLRPAREDGARLEAEVVEFPLVRTHNLAPWSLEASESGSMHVVHAYGFG